MLIEHSYGVRLPFIDRKEELSRLRKVLEAKTPGLVVLYGRRRLGKSRLIQESLRGREAAYYVGDDADSALQREAAAREIESVIEGFSEVRYPDWASLLDRYFREAPAGAVLALDELPSLVRAAPELPSVLQKVLDARKRATHVVLAGSSQRMMHGLLLEGSAPLYGRAQELLKVTPLPVGYLKQGLAVRSARDAVEAWSMFGGVPRYWELARGFPSLLRALRGLVLDPLGVLHGEPQRLLYDELDDAARASSVLALVAAGANRASEIASRIGMPVTTLSRPLAKLLDFGLVEREVPYGESPRDTKRSLYRVADPFLRTWYRFVEPNRSRLERGDLEFVERIVAERWPRHLGETWEELVRTTLSGFAVHQTRWASGERWWGRGVDGAQLELDVIAPSLADSKRVLVGEVKLTLADREVDRALAELAARVARCGALKGFEVRPVLFVLEGTRRERAEVVTGARWWSAVQATTAALPRRA